MQARPAQRLSCDPLRPVSNSTSQLCLRRWHQLTLLSNFQRAHRVQTRSSRTNYTGCIKNNKALCQCTMRETAEEGTVSTSNGSSLAIDETVPAGHVNSNGSTIIPQHGNGDQNGNGSGGGGSGDDGGGRGDDSFDSGEDPQPKALLLLLTIVAGSTSLYGIYQLVLAVGRLIEQRHSTTPEATADARSALLQPLQHTHSQQKWQVMCPQIYCCRPHDDIAALKRLLREVFTNQLQIERRMSALEPAQEVSDPFDTLTRARKGWQAMSNTGKAKVQLSGSLVTGSAILYSTASFSGRTDCALKCTFLASGNVAASSHDNLC